MRPREAFRRAHGWTLQEAANRFNTYMLRDAEGVDGAGEHVQLTASRLCDLKPGGWVAANRLPTCWTAGLAAIYGTDVASLLDYEDHTKLTVGGRLAFGQAMAGQAPSKHCAESCRSARVSAETDAHMRSTRRKWCVTMSSCSPRGTASGRWGLAATSSPK